MPKMERIPLAITQAPLTNLNVLKPKFLSFCNLKAVDLRGFERILEIPDGFLEGNLLTFIDLTPLANVVRINDRFLENNMLKSIDLTRLSSIRCIERRFLAQNSFTTIDLMGVSKCSRIGQGFLESNFLVCANLDNLMHVTDLSFDLFGKNSPEMSKLIVDFIETEYLAYPRMLSY